MMRNRFCIWAICCCVLAGCALSPQQVVVTPTVNTQTADIGRGRDLELVVLDARGDRPIGTRGGIYHNSSVITLARSLPETARPALVAAFGRLGFRVADRPTSGARATVSVVDLAYRSTQQGIFVKSVELHAKVQVVVEMGNDTYRNEADQSKDVSNWRIPSEQRNEELINEVLGDALSAALSEAALLEFLRYH